MKQGEIQHGHESHNYNRTIHSLTGLTPKYLMFGKLNPISPIPNFPTYSLDIQKAFQKSQISHMRNKVRFDSGNKDIQFKEGDTVYIENGNVLKRDKLDQVSIGPFKIKRKLSNSIYDQCRTKR